MAGCHPARTNGNVRVAYWFHRLRADKPICELLGDFARLSGTGTRVSKLLVNLPRTEPPEAMVSRPHGLRFLALTVTLGGVFHTSSATRAA
jgi:hypothetical protein